MAKQQDKPAIEPAPEPVTYTDKLVSVDNGNGTLIYDTTRPDGETVTVVVNGVEYTSQPVSNGYFWLVTGAGFESFTAQISN